MIYFSSDFHLGHKNITGPKISNWPSGYRNFNSIEEMDRTILEGINNTVEQDDTLYFLGDFAYSSCKSLQSYRDRIICKNIIFLKGNHDRTSDIKKIAGILHSALEIDIDGIRVCMSHYAHRVWNKSHHGSIHLYGHSHASLEEQPWGKSMDVGIDNAYRLTGEWRPFSWEEIKKIMSKRETKFIDHHKDR